MKLAEDVAAKLAVKLRVLFPRLDERHRWLLREPKRGALGHGGIRVVARAAVAAESIVWGVRTGDHWTCRAGASAWTCQSGWSSWNPRYCRRRAWVEPDVCGDPVSTSR
ncbi:hypothetical protein EV385_5119 [Krasilnikovia cinnamomea]|uniref:Uncharacterized protein n=1 Tax=Krasilnikovia cinnamomea TaxID=349313 RepID=A0A4Q7ZR15_9ACTN|nr:hypothetical protein EV385_5119 [Krasilnikovia cinnamomea]